MAEDGQLPAAGVRATMHPPPEASHSARWTMIPKGKRYAVVRGLVPLAIVAAIAILFLGGIGAAVVILGIAIIAAILVIAALHQKSVARGGYSSDPEDYMSRSAFYVGPFDHTGLVGAAAFERQHSRYNNPPQIRLLVTGHGFLFGSSGHSGTPLTVPFDEVESVDLIEGPRPRMLVVTPPIADRVGQVVITTKDGRVARLSGLPAEGVQEALVERGATLF